MTLLFQTHGGAEREGAPAPERLAAQRAARPAPGDVAVDEAADFGYLFGAPADAGDYLPEAEQTVADLDRLGELMIIDVPETGETDAKLPPILTYWGQFLDHELTARTDRESAFTSFETPHPPADSRTVEEGLKNARSPRFDLDCVYGGVPIGDGVTPDAVTVISGMRHPKFPNKMRVGTAAPDTDLPDELDPHRDLPRYVQVEEQVRNAALKVAEASMPQAAFEKFRDGLPQRAIIGDARNDENLIVAQFHLSFLRFHNRAIDALEGGASGWKADFHAAQTLTRQHYQWLIVEGYLKGVCKTDVVERVVAERARHFFAFRAEYDARHAGVRLGDALPLEFSAAGYRFGHSMVRAAYDYNKSFGLEAEAIPTATFDLLFRFTGGGGFLDNPPNRLPQNWIIDWSRFIHASPPQTSSEAQRVARKIDTELAPPLADMFKEVEDGQTQEIENLFKHLARRNLRRGYNLRLATGQALHRKLRDSGAVATDPIADVAALFDHKRDLKAFLETSDSGFSTRTPLWFYVLAEAEAGGGETLGELGSWIVAATFVGVLLSDPESALSRGFHPDQSPLKAQDGSPIDTIEKWLKFALVLE